MFNEIMFLYCAITIIATGLMAVRFKNPVYSVLSVLTLFFHMAGLYLLLNAEFLAAIQIIVYAGAVLVLYVFVIFLVNLRQEITVDRFIENHKLSTIASVALGLCLLAVIPSFKLGAKGDFTVDRIQQITHTKAMGYEIYSTYILPFEVAGLILLIAVIGGLVLARKDREDDDNSVTDACEVKK